MNSTGNKRKTCYLIDGFASLYRSHFALIRNPLVTSKGLNTSALFGFYNQVNRLLKQEKPDYIAAVFDTDKKTFRHKKYPEYKATRDKMPDELREQIPHLWNLLNAMQIFTISKPGFEADDIIGTLANLAADEGMDVYIVSGDKDFMQLINDHIFLYAPGIRGAAPKIYNTEGVVEKWGVPPDKIIDLLGLMGDSSDNIPGVRGVGEKSAAKLIHEYGSLEKSLEMAEKVANKRVKNGLIEYQKEALLSKELVTIDTHMDLNCSINDLVVNPFDIPTLTQLFVEYEFHGLLSQLDTPVPESKPEVKPEVDYITCKDRSDVTTFFDSISRDSILSFDLETTSVEPMTTDIVGFSFSTEKNSGIYIPILYLNKEKNHFADGVDVDSGDLNWVIETIKPTLENENIHKTGQNAKFDSLILKRYGIQVNGLDFDTMVAAHLINPEARSLKLDNLSLEYLNYTMVPITDLIGTGRSKITMAEVELEKAAFYAVEDADIARQLTPIFKDKLKENDLLNYFNKIEKPLIPVLMDMEYDGVYVDREMLEQKSRQLGDQLDELRRDIYQHSETEFNVNSTQQLALILFDRLGLRQVRKKSTAEEVLKILKNEHPLPGLILEYRKLNKLKNTYLDSLPTHINPHTGRIHSNFNQTIAATGRLSSSTPNFQNIPVRSAEGREIRKAFTAQKSGWKILSADYSQIELRIMAHISQDEGLMTAFRNDEDIHSRTASMVYGVSLEDVLPEMRRTAKVVNFGIMYGAGPFRMSQELGIPRSEAISVISAYFNQYSGIKGYIDSTLEKARELKYVQTILGRKRPVWNADSENRMRREAAERMAINMPIQGTAAEMIKLAMVSIHKKLKQAQMQSKMILQVHDELIFEVPGDELEDLKKMVIYEMETALPMSVPVKVDCGWGSSWYEAH